ncbi:MAG: molecular chaperone DnaJ [Patescibacteria group bacterium]|jgi:molecular chaperone DnaJ|nr:molecular chaperone DnaJ [Patescibacteria group bacterium]
MGKDYYEILGVNKSASQEEIKKAYYKLAHKYHPHKGGDETKMKEVNEAYSVLGNPEKRQHYNQFGSTFEQAQRQGGFGGFEGFRDFSDFAQTFRGSAGANQAGNGFSFNFGDMGDVFGDIFGGSSGRSGRVQQAQDLRSELTIEFLESVFGIEKNIKLNRDQLCDRCHGDGAEPGSKVLTCDTCKGTGQVVRNIGFGLGFPSVCPDCQGSGKKIEKQCTRCRGRGVTKESQELKVKIPAGIDNGQTIRLVGKGNEGPKGTVPGDLYLQIKVKSDPRFKRDGYDIVTKHEITFPQAALGDKIEIETVDGKVKLKIPEGTQSGKIFRIKSRGVFYLHSRQRGDHLAKIIVNTPTKLSRRQRQLFSELKDLDS